MTTKPSHITKGDVLDDLAFTRAETSALKIKTDLLDSILREIEKPGAPSFRVLCERVGIHEPQLHKLTTDH